MMTELFHPDDAGFFDYRALRSRAAQTVSRSSLIRRARAGDRSAAITVKVGFWPFVKEFELAIDRQSLPRGPLIEKFGGARVRRTFTDIARAVRDMKEEEGSHAAHWRADARRLGVFELQSSCVRGVQDLIDRSYTRDLPAFFATLAGTEFIAEELSRFLVTSDRFTNLFRGGRWIWGEVHVAPHENGPSHLDIDLDLARAYSSASAAADVEEMVLETVATFGRAADEIAEVLEPSLLAA